jgi:anti-sigma regulatory factor (Ser/Thr protein kinase)
VTAQRETVQGSGHETQRLRSERGLADLASSDAQESECELMVLDVVCAHAPARVRAALREIAELEPVREDVILVASELVTNAVMHSGGSAADTIQVRAVRIGEDGLISVDDPGLSNNTPRMRDADVGPAHGHGLRLVDQLACRWGYARNRGNRVWAQLATGRRRWTSGEQDGVQGPVLTSLVGIVHV